MSYVEPGFGLVLNFATTVREVILNALIIPPFPSIKGFIATTIAESITNAVASHIQIKKEAEENR
jgi:hypothetical protein